MIMNINTALLSILVSVSLMAQPPQAFKYQAVVKDANGNLITNQSVSFRIGILQDNSNGLNVYTEIHSEVTNDFGLASVEIGNGNPVSGDFSAIAWGSASYFLKVELDQYGGTNFQELGVSQLLSVPYALHSGTSDDDGDWIVSGNDMFSGVQGNVGIGISNPEIPLDVFGNGNSMVNGMISRFASDENDYSRIVVDAALGADAQISFMSNGSSKWTMGNDNSQDNSFVIRKGFGPFGTEDIFVIPSNGQADLNLPLLGNQGGLTVGKKAAQANGQTFSIVRSIGAHSVDTRYVNGFWAQSFGAYNDNLKLGNIGLAGSNKNSVDFMSFGSGGPDWWDTYSKFSVDKYGNVGIGRFAAHKSPSAKLEIDGSGAYDLLKINTEGGQPVFVVNDSGNVGIGTDQQTFELVVNGNAAKPGGGSWLTWSDLHLKDVKSGYKKGLDEILQLNPVVYSYREDTPQKLPVDVEYTGLIAQEVHKVFPEAVVTDRDGFLAIDAQPVNMAIINALKELKMENDLLKEKNRELEKRIVKLEEK